jgi:GNAT superfamily N-acetyltransferase
MIAYPLTKAHRLILAQAFRLVPRVDLSIDCVVEGQMGQAYVNRLEDPQAFLVVAGPFAYLAGDSSGDAATDALSQLPAYTLLMPSAPGWVETAEALFGPRLHSMDRYRLSVERISPDRLNRIWEDSPHREAIQPIDLAMAASVWGQDHILDISIFDSAEDFLERGVGFSLSYREQLAGVAYSSLVCSRGIEISIYVEEAYRRRGVATALSSRLLLWCLERGMEPHWDAANPESLKLAMNLGYQALDSYLAYYLVDQE